MSKSRPVYSTEVGRMCPECQQPIKACNCSEAKPPESDGIVRIRLETKQRKGKAVTVIDGIPLTGAALKKVAKQLKVKCGCGGSVVEQTVELQGDWRQQAKEILDKQGYKTKLV